MTIPLRLTDTRTCLRCRPSLDTGDCSIHPCLPCGTEPGTCCDHCRCGGDQERPAAGPPPVSGITYLPDPREIQPTHLPRCTCRECARSEVTREDHA